MRRAHAAQGSQKVARLRLGLRVFAALIALAVLEWYIAIDGVPGLLWWLIVIQLVEAGMIAYYFMHVAQLWRGDRHGPPDG